MNNKKGFSLVQAISLISLKLGLSVDDITGISFEDGSGRCFNYQISATADSANAGRWQFMRLGDAGSKLIFHTENKQANV